KLLVEIEAKIIEFSKQSIIQPHSSRYLTNGKPPPATNIASLRMALSMKRNWIPGASCFYVRSQIKAHQGRRVNLSDFGRSRSFGEKIFGAHFPLPSSRGRMVY